MQLRRLSSFSRIALNVLQKSAGERQKFQLVFASRHGDLVQSLSQLFVLARGELLSPTVFSMLVHNAVPGIARIVRGEHEPATAVAAGPETFGYGLIEALGRLATCPDKPVMLVYADQPVPTEYAADVGGPEVAHAVALLLGFAGEEPPARRLVMEASWVAVQSGADGSMQSLAFMRVLTGATEIASWRGGRGQWTWRKA